jgi:hypothetical protein
MAKQNRETLKNFFKKGALPSEQQFGDLIESSLNMLDEGFSRTPSNGVEITTHGDRERLLTFFRGDDPENPRWSFGFHGDGDALHFVPRTGEAAAGPLPPLTVAAPGRVGVNTASPGFALDVNGVVRAAGRIGVNPTGELAVPANGEWQDITGALTGCQAFEVMAGVGKKKSGRYALMHAIALNVFNPRGFLFNFLNRKKRISYSQAYYLSRRDMLRLRWHGEGEDYRLQLRSNTDYGDDVKIRYFITQLWFDSAMSGEPSEPRS